MTLCLSKILITFKYLYYYKLIRIFFNDHKILIKYMLPLKPIKVFGHLLLQYSRYTNQFIYQYITAYSKTLTYIQYNTILAMN